MGGSLRSWCQVEEQIVVLFAGVRGFIDRVDVAAVTAYEKAWLSFIKNSHPNVFSDMKSSGYVLTDDLDAKLTKLCDDFTTNFTA